MIMNESIKNLLERRSIRAYKKEMCIRDSHTNLHQQYHRYTNCKSGFSGFVVKKSHAKDCPDAATNDST